MSAQKRDRFYVCNWEVEQPKDRGIVLDDILEGEHPADITGNQRTMVANPVRVGTLPNADGVVKDSQGSRIYEPSGKSVALKANGGGGGAKTGLYAIPLNTTKDGKSQCVRASCYKDGIRNLVGNTVDKRTCVAIPCRMVGRRINENGKRCERDESLPWTQVIDVNKDRNKTNCLTTVQKDNVIAIPHEKGKDKTVYAVENGQIEIKGKKYPTKLKDGYYNIRKLTPVECERLQTMPDGYTDCVSNTQRYKGLGNGWTAEVIIHILQGALKDVPKEEKIIVLSMYDGIGTGRYCLDKMGFTNVEYHAFEIDKFAMKVANHNYPDIIQHGDAFQIREWGVNDEETGNSRNVDCKPDSSSGLRWCKR